MNPNDWRICLYCLSALHNELESWKEKEQEMKLQRQKINENQLKSNKPPFHLNVKTENHKIIWVKKVDFHRI